MNWKVPLADVMFGPEEHEAGNSMYHMPLDLQYSVIHRQPYSPAASRDCRKGCGSTGRGAIGFFGKTFFAIPRSARDPGPFASESAGALRRPPGTRFFCKKPVPGPSGKNSKWLAASLGICKYCDIEVTTFAEKQ